MLTSGEAVSSTGDVTRRLPATATTTAPATDGAPPPPPADPGGVAAEKWRAETAARVAGECTQPRGVKIAAVPGGV